MLQLLSFSKLTVTEDIICALYYIESNISNKYKVTEMCNKKRSKRV